MAEIKVLSKPDYQLTLSSNEKEALQKVLGSQKRSVSRELGITIDEHNIGYHVFDILDDIK